MNNATSEPGRVAALAEDRKADKYRDLPMQESLVLPADHGSDGSKIAGASEGGWQEDSNGDGGATVH